MEPTELDIAIWERRCMGRCPIGPLTESQAHDDAAYEDWCSEQEAEHEAQMRAGGRTICPDCGQRTVKHRAVCTVGYPGHPGAEMSDYEQCENCGFADLA